MYSRDGNDGPWSTFVIRVGTPPQVLKVLASTTVPETWVVSNEGCLTTDPTDCPDSRGKTFNLNASSTWDNQGFFALGAETNLPYTSNYDDGDYGFDSLGLGYPGSDGNTTLSHQVIASIATKDFFLGNLGLTPRPVNLTSMDDPTPSYLTSLKSSNLIPSLSYGYNAGAQYRRSSKSTWYNPIILKGDRLKESSRKSDIRWLRLFEIHTKQRDIRFCQRYIQRLSRRSPVNSILGLPNTK